MNSHKYSSIYKQVIKPKIYFFFIFSYNKKNKLSLNALRIMINLLLLIWLKDLNYFIQEIVQKNKYFKNLIKNKVPHLDLIIYTERF